MKKRNPYLTAGLVMTGILTALIVMGVFWTPYDPNAMAAGPKLAGPSLAHLMGTDGFGRDIFSRVLKGAGTTYGIALCTVAIGAVCGTAAGALTGYFGGVVDEVLMRLNDALTAFPSILLALVVPAFKKRTTLIRACSGAVISLAAVPFAPVGLPVLLSLFGLLTRKK